MQWKELERQAKPVTDLFNLSPRTVVLMAATHPDHNSFHFLFKPSASSLFVMVFLKSFSLEFSLIFQLLFCPCFCFYLFFVCLFICHSLTWETHPGSDSMILHFGGLGRLVTGDQDNIHGLSPGPERLV